MEICGFPRFGKSTLYTDKGKVIQREKTEIEDYDYVYHNVITESGCSGAPIVSIDENENPLIQGIHTMGFNDINAGVRLSTESISWISEAMTKLETMYHNQDFPTIPSTFDFS